MSKRPSLSLEDDLPEEPLVNLTPLIDVVFVVLISFMLIAPVLDIDSILLAPSRGVDNQESLPISSSPCAISIHADDSIWMQGTQINLIDLEKALRLEKSRFQDKTPQLIPDARSHFATYQQVKNVLEICGFEQIDILLRPQ